MQITPRTKAVGLIGHPVAHSLSPALHNHLYKKLGLDMVYLAFDVSPEHVSEAVEGMRALGFAGFNVTIPYKETVFRLLDRVDKEAETIGAVNTVKIENGILTGYNTDGQGFIKSLNQQGIEIKDKKVVILGAGGSARSLGIYVSKEMPESIHIVNRTLHKAEGLAEVINDYRRSKVAQPAAEIPLNVDIIINTTNLGMWPNTLDNPLAGYSLDSHTTVCDIVYNPSQTAMLQYASSCGCVTVEGIGMLIGQALKAVNIWLDQPLPEESWKIMFEAIDI